jgi:hypothetical protein
MAAGPDGRPYQDEITVLTEGSGPAGWTPSQAISIIRILPGQVISFGMDEVSTDVYEFKVNKRTVG